MYKAGLQQIINAQLNLWLSDFPTPTELLNITSPKPSHLNSLLKFFAKFNFFFLPNIDLHISGGSTPLTPLLNRFDKQDLKVCKTKELCF